MTSAVTHSCDENNILSDFEKFLKTKDLDEVGFVKNSTVFYATFSVKELLMFNDEVLKDRQSFSDDTFVRLTVLTDIDVSHLLTCI